MAPEKDLLIAVRIAAAQVAGGLKGDPGAVGVDGGRIVVATSSGVGDLGEAAACGPEEDFVVAVRVAAGDRSRLDRNATLLPSALMEGRKL